MMMTMIGVVKFPGEHIKKVFTYRVKVFKVTIKRIEIFIFSNCFSSTVVLEYRWPWIWFNFLFLFHCSLKVFVFNSSGLKRISDSYIIIICLLFQIIEFNFWLSYSFIIICFVNFQYRSIKCRMFHVTIMFGFLIIKI